MSHKTTDLAFESILSELEILIEKMGTGELTLEESLKNFEKGISLAHQCQQALKEAEQKVQILTSENGEFKLEPFIEVE